MEDGMLILSRKCGERIVIGNDIQIVVSKIAGDRVTIGIEAPPEIHIKRDELPPKERKKSA